MVLGKRSFSTYRGPTTPGGFPRAQWKPRKRARRAGYRTVPRTRGVYGSGEMKYYDQERGVLLIQSEDDWVGCEVNPSQTPANVKTLFCPTVGSAINQRIGRKVKLFKIKIRGCLILPQTMDQDDARFLPTVRLMLVQDMQANGTEMSAESLMSSASTAALAMNSFQNVDNFGRFKVLYDKVFRFTTQDMAADGVATNSGGGYRIPFKITKKFKVPIVVNFNATNGGTVADITDNTFNMIANTTVESAATGEVCQIEYNSRCCYKE